MYEVWVASPAGARTAIIAADGLERPLFSRLTYTRTENQVTELTLTMPYRDGLVALFPLDARLEVYRDGILDGETQWFVRVPPKVFYDERGALLVEVKALCALYLLTGRIVAYPAGSSQAVKTGVADNLMKALVRENLGILAIADRNLSAYLDVQADAGQGASVYKTMPRRNVLLVCQELARASAQAGKPIFFDVVVNQTTGKLEFRTYLNRRGADHSVTAASPVVLSPEFGTLADSSRSFDHREEITVVYCAGQNTGADRVIVSVADDARRLATPFNRRELFVDARYLALTAQLATEADGALWRRRPVQQLSGTIQSTPDCQYRVHWGWGDLLAAEFNGEILAARVHTVTVDVADGVERVTAQLRADSTEADSAVRRIEGQLDSAAAEELPVFTATPTAGAAPLAGSDGRLALGWLPDSLALDSDLTWANLSGKPGVLTAALANQNANTVWAGPVSGAAAAPAFRTLTSVDVPPLDAAKITSGVFAPVRGGTGVANTGTLTVNAPTSIFNGGTIELEGSTLTVPDSGTAVVGSGIGERVAVWAGPNTLGSSNELRFSVSSGLYARATNAQNACRIESVNVVNPTDIYTLSTRFNNTGAPTTVRSNDFRLYNDATTGNIANLQGYYVEVNHRGSGTASNVGCITAWGNHTGGNVTSWKMIDLAQPGKSGTGTLGALYGIYLDNMTRGSVNYAIYTNSGPLRFGDYIDVAPITAPGAPSNHARVFTRNTAGVLELCARFPTGDMLLLARQGVTVPTYTVTNVTVDRAYDANATTLAEVAHVLGTLINDLKTRGVLV
jgi:hypothetical protein